MPDETMRDLGPVPADVDVEHLVARYAGSTRVTAEQADALLAQLETDIETRPRTPSIASGLDAYDAEVDDGFEVHVEDDTLVELEIEVALEADADHDD